MAKMKEVMKMIVAAGDLLQPRMKLLVRRCRKDNLDPYGYTSETGYNIGGSRS